MNPKIFALAAVSRFDDEKLLVNAQKLVAIGRASGDFVERITCIGIKEIITVNRPAAGKLRNEFFAINHVTAKTPVAFENVAATLNVVGVAPLSYETTCNMRL